jgi:hypothetical protein
MRVLINDKPHDPLTPAQERMLSLARAQDSAESSVLSAEEATLGYIRPIKRLFVVAGVFFALIACSIALVAEPSDRAATCGFVIVAGLSVAAALFLALRRRARIWNDRMGLRQLGLPPAGSRIGFDATGLSVGDRAFPWNSLQIHQADFAEFTSRYASMYRIERLALAASSGPVVLDAEMMRNGRVFVDNIWRRLHPAVS